MGELGPWALDTVVVGDCLDVMAQMPGGCVDTIITDPPYGLEFMGKEWDKLWAKRDKSEDLTGKSSSPFLAARVNQYVAGKQAQDWHHRWATAALRVAKPGAMMLAFGGTRTFHRLACAIEDAGWEIRDTMMWLYGSGFPKSHDISKAIDKATRAEWFQEHAEELRAFFPSNSFHDWTDGGHSPSDKWWQEIKARAKGGHLDPRVVEILQKAPGWFTSAESYPVTAPATEAAKLWDGWGTALKPAWEPIIVAMKPRDGTFANNALKHGVAGLWIDGARVGHANAADKYHRDNTTSNEGIWGNAKGSLLRHSHPKGRWPANLIHDGSEEVLGLFPNSTSDGGLTIRRRQEGQIYQPDAEKQMFNYGDSGSAARFFYCAKSAGDERWFFCRDCQGAYPRSKKEQHWHGHVNDKGEKTWKHLAGHPTVKPLALMEYLCRLTKTPTGGVVADFFAGSGSTLVAAKKVGRHYFGCDTSEEYVEIACKRLSQLQLALL